MNLPGYLTDLVRRYRGTSPEKDELGILETGTWIAQPFQACPKVEELEDFAAGVCSETSSTRILVHIEDCGHCAPLVRTFLQYLEKVKGPQPELIPSDPPGSMWVPMPPKYRTFILRRAAPIFTLASIIFLAVTASPPLWNAYNLHRTQSLIAAASRDSGTNDVRLSWSLYPKEDGLRRRDPRTPPSPADYPSLSAASSHVAEKAYSSDPNWLRLRGRVKLLLHEDDDAVKLLRSAGEQNPTDPDTQIDLAVALFERDTRTVPEDTDNKKFNVSESVELLTKLLREPKLSQEQKAVVLFDLAALYEKMQSWDNAILTWKRYLDVDHSGQWHNEAEQRLAADNKNQQRSKPQGYREPSFFLQHFADPDVQQSLEEYQDIALRAWLTTGVKNYNSDAFLAAHKLGELMEERHGDTWLNEFLNAFRPDQSQALELLGGAVEDNKQGRYNKAEGKAAQAAVIFAARNNDPGTKRAKFEALYASQRLLVAKPCIEQAQVLDRDLQSSRYRWLQTQTALERAVCLNFNYGTDAALQQLQIGQKKAEEAGFRILSLRSQALEAGMNVSLNCNKTWQLVQTGLEQYWQGPSAPARLYEFYSPIKQCMEKQKMWNAAEAIERRMITILEKEIDPKDENAVLEATAHSALAQILTELDDDGAAEDQANLAILLLGKADPIVARTYQIPIKLELADMQLDRGEKEASLATVQDVRKDFAPADDPLLLLNFLRVQGDVHLNWQQWNEAEDDYKRGLVIAEGRFYDLKREQDRQNWTREIGDLCRGLVEVFLRQKRDVEALQLWEWFQSRSFAQSSRPRPDEVRWTEIEQTVLNQPLPSSSNTRLVYVSAREQLYIWIVSSDEVKTISVQEQRDDLRRLIHRFVQACSTPQDPNLPLPELEDDSRKLFDLLLKPVIADLHDSDSIAVDLDETMAGLLLEPLQSPEGQYFGQKYPVTYSPGYIRESKLRPPVQEVPRSGLVISVLKATKNESTEFSAMFPDIPVLGDSPMTAQELASRLASNELFIFIGHAQSGALILENGQSLRAKDFRPEYLNNLQLAVLAACSTGLASTDPSSTDTSSLVSAFQTGGTPHVIASRWDVDSNVTADLMARFYVHLKNNQSVPRALFEARQEIFRSGYRHPYYWAAFVLNGKA